MKGVHNRRGDGFALEPLCQPLKDAPYREGRSELVDRLRREQRIGARVTHKERATHKGTRGSSSKGAAHKGQGNT